MINDGYDGTTIDSGRNNIGSRNFNKSGYKPGENIHAIKLTARVGLYKARLSSWRSGMMVGYDG